VLFIVEPLRFDKELAAILDPLPPTPGGSLSFFNEDVLFYLTLKE
jgi:hypothetical protein